MSPMGLGIFLLAVHTVFGQFSSGGPSTFGYDASSACSKPYSRSGRAHFEKLPCDFSRQNWCTVAGNAYPWQAVRRFVHENQGLMRRMYGDEKHINVLKSELEKNDIELEYEERYKRHFDESWFSTNEEDNDFISENEKSSEGRAFTSELPEFHEFTRSNFQPTETTIESSTSSSSSMSSSLASSATSSTTPTALPSTDADEPGKSTMKSPITLSEIARVKNSSLNEIPGPLEVAKEDLSERTVTEAANGTEVSSDTTLEPKATPATSTAAADRIDASEDDGESIVEDHDEKQFRPRPEYRPDAKPDGSSIEGQLFQDVAAKDHIKHPVLPLIGVNACPVKEEIVAPFWANNTRGEVLALLNLYPFEQYVHWEKCTHENQQMYCRQGCRCEQQYRLHRLLAYDPNNECRGIFSDWFKFPSCCVCRCYDLPIEFRVTSRSPRVRKQRVKLRPPGGRGKP